MIKNTGQSNTNHPMLSGKNKANVGLDVIQKAKYGITNKKLIEGLKKTSLFLPFFIYDAIM